MKNLLFVGMVTFCMSSAFASAQQTIPREKLESYKTAVKLLLSSEYYQCSGTGDPIATRVDNATSAVIENDGSQPLLIFTSLFRDRSGQEIIYITTSADSKKIISIQVELMVFGEINSGDLNNPSISKGMVSKGIVATCVAVSR